MHAVHHLYLKRKAQSTKPFKARGCKVERCQLCLLAKENCICSLKARTKSQCKFVLLMHDTEVLKPSNTGRLIADVVPDTDAYLWSRTDVDDALLKTLNDPQYQAYVVFPKEYVSDDRPTTDKLFFASSEKVPLFIMLDGSWKEAKKMFRKSEYLKRIPVISISQQVLDAMSFKSEYYLRKASKDVQLSTAEVASFMLKLSGETFSSNHLMLWVELFSYRYQKSVCQKNLANPEIESKYQAFYDENFKV